MASAIDRGDMERVAETIEAERTRQRYRMTAIDQPLAEAAFAFGEMVEMDTRGILIEPRRDHVFGVFNRDADDMIDLLAGLVVAEAMRAAGQYVVIVRGMDDRATAADVGWIHAFG